MKANTPLTIQLNVVIVSEDRENTEIQKLREARKCIQTQSMQGNQVERKRNTNLKDCSFMSIVWVLELIDRTLVYGVFLLQVQNKDRIEFMRGKLQEYRKNNVSKVSREKRYK